MEKTAEPITAITNHQRLENIKKEIEDIVASMRYDKPAPDFTQRQLIGDMGNNARMAVATLQRWIECQHAESEKGFF